MGLGRRKRGRGVMGGCGNDQQLMVKGYQKALSDAMNAVKHMKM